MPRRKWPAWWYWELEPSPHVLKRMSDRGFSEVELRAMLEVASGYRRDIVPGRWVTKAKHRGKPWEVVVEPDATVELLVVITAYPVEA